MKKMKHSITATVAAILMAATLTFTPPAKAVTTSAVNCNAANLTQALLGISMSQLGIVNNAAISLFIACSVDYFESGFFTRYRSCGSGAGFIGPPCGGPPNDLWDVFVEASFPESGSDGLIQCVYRSGFFGAPGFFSAQFVIVAGQDTSFAPDPPVALPSVLRGYTSVNANIIDGTIPHGGVGQNNTVVCALNTGEGITSVATTRFLPFVGPILPPPPPPPPPP